MDFNLSEEQSMLRAAVMRFVETDYDAEVHRKLTETAEGFDPANWQQFAELGWLSIPLPEDMAGFAFTFEEIAILMEAFGRAMVLEPFMTTAVLCARIVDKAGNATARDRCLPQIANGELKLALAYSEGPAEFDATQKQHTRAEQAADGFRLSGAKTMVFDAPSADRLIVSASLGDAQTFALFLVDRGDDAIVFEEYELIDGTRGADITFDDVSLVKEALLAQGEHAVVTLQEALDRATLACIAESVGAMAACMDITSQYIKERQQFGQPIGKFQALQHIMAESFVDAEAARSMLYHGIANIDGDAVERQKAISLAKVLVGKAGHTVSANGIQLHGGYGVTDEYIISRYYKRLMRLEKAFGDVDWHTQRYSALMDRG